MDPRMCSERLPEPAIRYIVVYHYMHLVLQIQSTMAGNKTSSKSLIINLDKNCVVTNGYCCYTLPKLEASSNGFYAL